MEAPYQELQTIFQIVKDDPKPETYLCSPGEIILRQSEDWDSIVRQLQILVNEELIIMKKLDKMAVCITHKGFEKAKSLMHSNYPGMSFSFSHA